ncbi:hybrid sensor histidine kinase/response regulator [Azohydromonas australica]|uniref:hybrid sensor histidine kinase/response regulator n=1 Tax=Azohydromonas australica TaxID=364039 RepID=UPI00040552F3|nr:response regulator [Azohydromonas australica]
MPGNLTPPAVDDAVVLEQPPGAPAPVRRLRWKPYALFLATITLLVATLLAYALGYERQQVRERAVLATQNFATLLDRQLSAVFDKTDVVLRTAVWEYESRVRDGSLRGEDFNRFLAHQQSLLPEALALRVAGPDGVVRYGGVGEGPLVSQADRDFFIRARDSAAPVLIVSGPLVARIAQQWVIVLARRLNAPDGAFAGVLYASLATAELGRNLSGLALGPNGAATIRTADLALVHRHPEARDALGSRNVSAQLQQVLRSAPEGGSYVATTPLDGIERSNAYRRLRDYPFYILVGVATQDYLGEWQDNAVILCTLGGVLVLLTGIAAVLIHRAAERQHAALDERTRAHAAIQRLLAERTQLGEALARRADEALAASRAKSDFLANMSHEIRTPMNAVLGLVYLLEREELSAAARTLVRKVHNAGRMLLGIINDVLDYSKIEAGRLELEDAPFELADVLDNLSTVMAATAGAKNLELVIHPPPRGVDHLRGDALRLEQVLVNLTGNAIKFTDRGHVDVDIRVDAQDTQAVTLRFLVCDTGIGITPQKQREIFAPFSQADASTTRRFGGTGLGLTICRRLVEMMGGEIGLLSIPGSGSEFWFTVQLRREAVVPAEALPGAAMAGLEVLIADDSAVAREALHKTAEHLGWKADMVASGSAAVDAVLARRARRAMADVVLLDWQMPDMDGLAVARAIRQAGNGVREPIVVMVTAFSREELQAHPDSRLVDAVLPKPVTTSSLFNAVQQVLHGRGELAAQAPAGGRQGRLQGLHLLVVDDSEINREVAQGIFGSEGAQVSLAEDGQQALEWLHARQGAVDIVLMDVQMPVMDGHEATRAIRRTPALARLPVVALTAGAFQSEQETARATGMDDFIAKPINVAAAVDVILRLTGRRDGPRPAAAPPPAADGRAGDAGADFPGLDPARGLQYWRDPALYVRCLRLFEQEYADCVHTLGTAEAGVVAALAHKLKGAAASLALDGVASAAEALERDARGGALLPQALARLDSALALALDSIRRYAGQAPGD